jgi:L-asparagine oxygenase
MHPVIIYSDSEIGEIPSTPNTTEIKDDLTPTATRTLIEVAKNFGTPISFAQEQNGRLIQNIVPVAQSRDRQISTSSESELLLHTEAAFHPYRPDHIFLMCLRDDANALTTYATIESIFPKLTSGEVSILSRPKFETSLDESFISPKQPDTKLLVSILAHNEPNGWSMTFDYALMRGIDEQAEIALQSFKNAVIGSAKSICLKKGDIAVIDNRTTVHGRTQFLPRYDGTDRWLKRIFTIRRLPPRQHIDGHKIITRFGL